MVPVTDIRQKEHIEAVKNLILSEVNVKELNFADNSAGILVKKIKPDFKKLGPRYGKVMKQLAAAIQAMTQEDIASLEQNGSFAFNLEGVESVIVADDVEIISEDIPGWLVANEGRLTIALDITVTDELRKEGLARELVNRIQNLRKSSGLEITDKIRIAMVPVPEMNGTISEYTDYIQKQVLAESIEMKENLPDATELDLDDFKLYVNIEKV